MVVIVDIKPQWPNLSAWYWDKHGGMSIWEMLEHEYGAFRASEYYSAVEVRTGLLVRFPDEKAYTAFLLRWS